MPFFLQHKENLGIFGLFQCIGWRAFLPYMKLSGKEKIMKNGQQILVECIDNFAKGDREYTEKQQHWLQEKIVKRSQLDEEISARNLLKYFFFFTKKLFRGLIYSEKWKGRKPK
jgi:tRNA A37 N6-isopentenylltransferase MiaA